MTTPTTTVDLSAERAEVDRIDQAIIALVEERKAVSARIQDKRIAAGGSRVDLAREQSVFARYDSAFGQRGVAIARELLVLCRGK